MTARFLILSAGLALAACQQESPADAATGLLASRFASTTLSSIRLAPQTANLKWGDSTTFCAFPIFTSGQVGIGVQDHPVCDFAYSRLGLHKWQTNLSADQQALTDTLCIAFTVTGGTFTPADSMNCGVPVMTPTARLLLTLQQWIHRLFG